MELGEGEPDASQPAAAAPPEGEANGQDKGWHLPADKAAAPVPAHLEIIIDGADYLQRWRELLATLEGAEGTVLHSAWRMSNVTIPDKSKAMTDKLYNLFHANGSKFFVRLSGHGATVLNLLPFLSLKVRTRLGRGDLHPYIDQSFASRVGSHHQKSTCFICQDHTTVMLGSIDMAKRRIDDSRHTPTSSTANRPSHDVGLVVHGPAAHQIAAAEIDLWLLSSYYRNRVLWPYRTPKPMRRQPEEARASVMRALESDAPWRKEPSGSRVAAEVQVLRTRSRPSRTQSWPLTFENEMSVKDAYLSALARAKHYIYIEDQYFTPNFGDASYGSWPWYDQASPMSVMRKALRDKVQLFVVVPGTDPNGPGIRAMRDNAVDALRDIAAQLGAPAPLIVRRRTVERTSKGVRNHPVHVHAKVLICDDEYAIVGSQNINVRSFTNDVELGIGMTGPAVPELRRRLWAEHVETADFADWEQALAAVKANVQDQENTSLAHYESKPRAYPPGPLRRRIWRFSETRHVY